MGDGQPTWEMVVGVSSVVIALCALGTSIWHGIITRHNAKLSCRPVLTIAEKIDVRGLEYEAYLVNSGVGPAIIKNVSLFIDNVRIDGSCIGREVSRQVFPNQVYQAREQQYGDTHSLSANGRELFFSITFERGSHLSKSDKEKLLNKVTVIVEYKSIMNEKFDLPYTLGPK